MKTVDLDERRRLLLPGSHEETIQFAVQEWIALANRAISDHGFFTVALSGGSTPKAIFKLLSTEYQDAVDWNKVFLFWSDERAVPPQSPESNYHMAMKEAGLENLHIHDRHIFRMQAEKDLERYSDRYAEHVHRNVKREQFDLIMLGMGDDGHTASLFPGTEALDVTGKLVVPNYIPQKECWRMTFTFDLINKAHAIYFYVLGENKADILERVLLGEENFPSQRVGTAEHKASWVIDDLAAQKLLVKLK